MSKSRYSGYGLRVILAALLLALTEPMGAAAEIEMHPLLTVRGDQWANASGGKYDDWEHNGGQLGVGVGGDDVAGRYMRFRYVVKGPRQNVGQWFALRHMNMRAFGSVQLTLRGRDGGEMLTFGLKDDRWYEERISLEKYLPGGLSNTWQTLAIPLSEFSRVRQWESMDNFSISFSHSETFATDSEIFLRDVSLLKFTDADTKPMPPPERPDRFPIPLDVERAADEELLELVQRSAFGYFWNEVNPDSGLVKDRCYAFGPDERRVASISAVGFGLSAICIGAERGWITHEEAVERVLLTLQYFDIEAQMNKGFYFHYYEMETGAPFGDSEISSVDTGLFLLGVLTAKHYFEEPEIKALADRLLEKCEWPWMLNEKKFLSMGWLPGNRFIPHMWRDYNEGILLYFLGTASPTHPIPAETWNHITRESVQYADASFIPGSGENSLFVHQYPMAWLDLRDVVDAKGINYFSNSVEATRGNQAWCEESAHRFKAFENGFWGVTACDGPKGYTIQGAPYGHCEGTVAPTAAVGSMPFTPEASMEQLRKWLALGERAWGKYGFVDAYNADHDWFSSVHLAIDQGAILLMLENHRTGMIWDLVSREPSLQRAYAAMGFRPQPGTETEDSPATDAAEATP